MIVTIGHCGENIDALFCRWALVPNVEPCPYGIHDRTSVTAIPAIPVTASQAILVNSAT